jgi:hypothetical protein
VRGFGAVVARESRDFTATYRVFRQKGRGFAPGKMHENWTEGLRMKLVIEIVAAALLVFCITATSAAFAAGKTGRSADGLSCAFSMPANASPAARCAAIKRQCGGKFYANYCGDKLLSAM